MNKKEIHFRTMIRPDQKLHLQIMRTGLFSDKWETVANPLFLIGRDDINHQPSNSASIFGTPNDCIKYVYFEQDEKPEKLILIEHPPLIIHPIHKPA